MRTRAVKQKTKAPEKDDFGQSCKSAMPDAAAFILTALSIVCFGLVMLYSTSYVTSGLSFFTKQLTWLILGFLAFCAVVFAGAKTLSNLSLPLLLGCVGLLVLALMFRPIKGANRWILLGPFSIQPSEFTKVVLVLFMAWFLSRRTRDIENSPFLKVTLPSLCCAGIAIGLVYVGKDLGTTCLLVSVCSVMLLVAGVRLWCILIWAVPFSALAGYLIIKFSPERLSRLTVFMNPEPTQSGDGYQLWNSMLALGSGHWFGLGFTESRIKLKYLPEPHTDFILAIVGEELGYVTLLAVLLLYILLAYSGLRIASKSRTRQGMLIAFGMICFITMQAFINMGVVAGALPTKGMPAPLISYGGSNLVACMMALGCVFSVALDNSYPDYEEGLRAKIASFFSGKKKKKKK